MHDRRTLTFDFLVRRRFFKILKGDLKKADNDNLVIGFTYFKAYYRELFEVYLTNWKSIGLGNWVNIVLLCLL